MIARNRTNRGDDDLVLSHIDELNIDQLWLMAVDVGDGLTTADAYAIQRFRENGGGVLTARGHHDLGRCLSRLGSLGVAYEFHTKTVDAWPNYHSGASGDYQPVLVEVPVHELARTNHTTSGRIEWFPAHPHEGWVSAKSPSATAIARARSTATGPCGQMGSVRNCAPLDLASE